MAKTQSHIKLSYKRRISKTTPSYFLCSRVVHYRIMNYDIVKDSGVEWYMSTARSGIHIIMTCNMEQVLRVA